MTVAIQHEITLVSPPPESYYPVVWKLLQIFSYQTLDSFSPNNLEEVIEKSKQDDENGGLTFAVMMNGEVVGGVWFEATGDDMCLGHLVFERDILNASEKLQATGRAVRLAFKSGFRKIIWSFFSDNRAYRLFLSRLGAEYEGTFKQHARRNGELVDADFMASFPVEAEL